MNEIDILLERMRNVFIVKNIQWREIRMFGGICFMVDEKMCFGTYKGGLMARLDPNNVEEYIQRPWADKMVHGGRLMKRYAFVEMPGIENDVDLEFWIDKCLEFNPMATRSKKKKK